MQWLYQHIYISICRIFNPGFLFVLFLTLQIAFLVLRAVKSKLSSVFKSISGQGKMTKQLELALRHARTMEEVDMLVTLILMLNHYYLTFFSIWCYVRGWVFHVHRSLQCYQQGCHHATPSPLPSCILLWYFWQCSQDPVKLTRYERTLKSDC